ncbi:bzip transcription factor [Diplodia corticola]|uniref:Bzip transcription factor n=1 Tax=Diplodia corticola TaxID=236234 RepID=A0A1J9SCB0_9PEZI|nr:bzip transcription factor [Diplodia corticola]OJD37476.1 bzip transcription factor [Diplodia corticola]
MDYSSYFSVPPPQQYYIGLPPTPNYDGSSDKLNLQSHLDPSSFLQYDAFSFPSLPASSSPTHAHSSAVAPQLHAVGSVDSGIHLDLDAASSAQHIQHTQDSPIHATLSTAPGLYSSSTSSSDALPSAQQQQQQQQQQPIGSTGSPSHPTSPIIGSNGGQHTRSSSEEKDNGGNPNSSSLTPAQSRRKAQNRAAQRAFRERKERHVRELEDKLRALESSTHSLQSDNERLKLLLQRAKTENEILRATNHHRHRRAGSTGSGSGSGGSRSASPGDDGEMQLDLDKDLYTTVPGDGAGAAASSGGSGQQHARANIGRSTPHLLGASQTWDLIQSHSLVLSGAVDVADVCERLRTAARCDGQGPVFEETAIYRIIEEESSRGGGDALI